MAARLLTFCATAALLFLCFAVGDKPKLLKKENTPPGTLWLKDGIYMDETEISNFSYLQYLHWLKIKEDTAKYNQALPDTTVWGLRLCGPYMDIYYRHPAYREYPVVGISYEQALDFCRWRTEMVKLNLLKINKHPLKNKSFYYRLPSEEEWEYAASAGLDRSQAPYGYEKHIDKKGTYMIAVKEGRPNSCPDNTSPCVGNGGKKNKSGYYNLCGNVAEMILEKGISKGGSWYHSIQQANIDSTIAYAAPQSWLGFRCVCVVK